MNDSRQTPVGRHKKVYDPVEIERRVRVVERVERIAILVWTCAIFITLGGLVVGIAIGFWTVLWVGLGLCGLGVILSSFTGITKSRILNDAATSDWPKGDDSTVAPGPSGE